jgi:hypothetical protein
MKESSKTKTATPITVTEEPNSGGGAMLALSISLHTSLPHILHGTQTTLMQVTGHHIENDHTAKLGGGKRASVNLRTIHCPLCVPGYVRSQLIPGNPCGVFSSLTQRARGQNPMPSFSLVSLLSFH